MKRWPARMLIVALAGLMVLRCRPGGTITDSESDAPIAGAAVHVSWGHYPYLPSPHGSPQFSCDGSAFALTDATGGYHVSLPLSVAVNPMTVYQVRVVAPGHYDDVLRQGLSEPYESIMRELPWRETSGDVDWSRSLRSFGAERMNAGLLALQAGSITRSCDQEQDLAFAAQRWRAFAQTLCGAGRGDALPSVRTDVFGFLLNRPRPDLPSDVRQRFAMLSSQLVGSDFTGAGTDALPGSAMRNACALIHQQITYPALDSAEPMTLHLRLGASQAGARIANVPVRVLWASRHLDHPAGEGRYSREWIIRRGLVGYSDANGEISVPISREMLAEQTDGQMSFEVDALVDDAVGFGHHLPIKNELNGNNLYDHFSARFSELRPADEMGHATSIQDAERLANSGTGVEMLGGTAIWRYPARLAELMAQQRLSGMVNRRYVYADGSDTVPLRIVHLYPWRWPGIALLWRAHALIALEPDVESDPAALTALQYTRVASTFARLCSEPDQRLTAQETFQALQVLWWMESQTSGRETAGEHARQRAVSWDRGITCEFEGERMHRMGRTGPPLHAAEVCKAWRSVPGALSPALLPYRFKDLVLDFSHRPGACPQFPNNGAFQ